MKPSLNSTAIKLKIYSIVFQCLSNKHIILKIELYQKFSLLYILYDRPYYWSYIGTIDTNIIKIISIIFGYLYIFIYININRPK